MEEWKIKIINDLENRLSDLLLEWEGFESLTTDDINEFYGFVNDCQISTMIKELKETLGE